jgi:hypothetical protein
VASLKKVRITWRDAIAGTFSEKMSKSTMHCELMRIQRRSWSTDFGVVVIVVVIGLKGAAGNSTEVYKCVGVGQSI